MSRYIKLIPITIFFTAFILSLNVYAQTESKIKYAIGLSTTQIMGNNRGAKAFASTDPDLDAEYGGSFGDAQPGIEFRVTIPLDEEANFRLPFGFDYQFFGAKERLPLSEVVEQRFRHALNIASPYLGIHYVFVRFPLAESKLYAGLEARASYIHDILISLETRYSNNPDLDEYLEAPTKDESWRFGGMFRIGAEGTIIDNYQVNLSAGFSIMNLIGADDERGELLTPLKTFDVEESLVSNFHVSLLIQYTF